MSKQDEINKLKWKYFFQQKAQEVVKPIIINLFSIIIPLLLSIIFMKDWNPIRSLDIPIFGKFLIVWGFGLFLYVVILLIIIAVIKIIIWINENLKKAHKRATKEVNKKSKGGQR